MKLLIALTSIFALTGTAFAAVAIAAPIPIYRAEMNTEAQRAEVVKLAGEACGRGGSERALRVRVGKRTRECMYRTPVVGRDLEISAVGRILSGTVKPLQRAAYVSVALRTGGAAAGYQLLVYPLQRKAQLVRKLADGSVRYMQIARNLDSVKGLDMANVLRLRAFNVTSGPERGLCRIQAYVGNELIADVTDGAAGELDGRASGFAIGAQKAAKGLIGSFGKVVIRVPDPNPGA